jgi:hypothetical protein
MLDRPNPTHAPRIEGCQLRDGSYYYLVVKSNIELRFGERFLSTRCASTFSRSTVGDLVRILRLI